MAEIYYHGPLDSVADALRQGLGRPVRREFPAAPAPGDLVFLSVRTDAAHAATMSGCNAFSACRSLKQDPQVRVFLLVEPCDPYAAEVARFCLADGTIAVGASGELDDLDTVRACSAAALGRTAVDDLLLDLERELRSDEGRRASAIQAILCGERPDSLVERLTDPSTGLFGGAFAKFKLEEEFKRAMRFHQPLSLVLLEIGEDALPGSPARRDACLAELAGVFLNECRDIDVLARFTETTFLLLLPSTGMAGATALTRRLLAELRRRSFVAQPLRPHAGLATVPASGLRHRRDFLARAEACLRLARAGHGEDGLCARGV